MFSILFEMSTPLPITGSGQYITHLILFACDIEYKVKVTASFTYENQKISDSIYVTVPKTVS